MKQIPLNDRSGNVAAYALVDDDDYDFLMEFKWHRTTHGYASSSLRDRNKLLMHYAVYERAYGKITKRCLDHKDRNRINNQKSNLREATDGENALNKGKRVDNTTGYTGVRLDKRFRGRIRYQAFSTQGELWTSIGYFDKLEDAAIAHDIWMKRHYSHEFLVLNFPALNESEIDRVETLLSQPKKRKGTSRYRGVAYFKQGVRTKRWLAQIAHEGQHHKIGYYLTEEEAAIAYNERAIELHGSKAKLNTIST